MVPIIENKSTEDEIEVCNSCGCTDLVWLTNSFILFHVFCLVLKFSFPSVLRFVPYLCSFRKLMPACFTDRVNIFFLFYHAYFAVL